jgi:GTP-binding protein YchF
MLSVGIVGFPNAGKSTLFNALLSRQIAPTAPYAFCTIEPNVGVVEVPDERLKALAQIDHPEKIIPAAVEFVDIAGLVKGAAKGEGLGNKFLAHIREVDVICFVLRAFESEKVDLAGSVDPKTDLRNLQAELILKDLETIEKLQKAKIKEQNDNSKFKINNLLKKLIDGFNKGIMGKDLTLDKAEREFVKPLCLLTDKPYFIVLNVNEKDLNGIEQTINQFEDWTVIPICAKVEAELADLSAEDKKEYLVSLGLKKSGLERLIQTAYQHLGLISFLTSGSKETRAWTIKKGTLAPQAAGVIHSDFEKGFIKAVVCSFKDYIDWGGWQKAGEKGKIRLEGKDYVVEDGDVIEFKVRK